LKPNEVIISRRDADGDGRGGGGPDGGGATWLRARAARISPVGSGALLRLRARFPISHA